MEDKIGKIMRKTYGYWWVDGLAEIGMGLMFMILGGYNYLLIKLQLSTTASIFMAFGEPVIFLVCWFSYGRLVRWTKERLTYLRTGYVAYQQKNRKDRTKRAIISGILGLSVALTVTYIGPEILKINSLIMVVGVLALVTLFLAIWHGVNRLILLAVVQFALGLWVSTLPLAPELASTLLMAAIGAVWLLSGIIVFIIYLLRTKPVQEENV